MDKRRVSLVLGWCFLACGVLGPVWALSAGQMSGPALLAGLCLVPGFLLLKGARRAPDADTPGEAGALFARCFMSDITNQAAPAEAALREMLAAEETPVPAAKGSRAGVGPAAAGWRKSDPPGHW